MERELDIAIRALTRTLLAQDKPGEIYRTVLNMVQTPMIDEVMIHCRGNQSKAAMICGLNRGTLRGKLTKMAALNKGEQDV